ncbi:MAG TPA: 16S rRNA (guanine(527)-N(7))-methyltransferase RsmG [Candidatus Sulfotelmatobacter sp.]|nr:16S rRNA (guanine(527)-N(7))-methyltransferase RsmG [Candidatus Sulfotelmatobacter sp.]
MQASRIAELLGPFLGPPHARHLTPDALGYISTYIDLLQRWNARVNLTAIRNEEEIVIRHFGESLFAARHLFPGDDWEGHSLSRAHSATEGHRALAPEDLVRAQDHERPSTLPAASEQRRLLAGPERSEGTNAAVKLADVGSGAGFPGIPIKLWHPKTSLTLVESNHKKATFLREVTRALTLTDVNILNVRAESLTNASFDVVTLRAVERFASILPIAAGLVAKGGRLALLIAQSQLRQAHSTLPALDWLDPIAIPHSRSRLLVIATGE